MIDFILFLAAAVGPVDLIATGQSPDPAESTTIDPARLAAARRLLDASDSTRMMQNMIDQMAAQQKVMLTNSLRAKTGQDPDPKLVEAISAVTERFLRTQLAGDSQNILSVIASIYARNLSAEDMDKVAEMQSDPAVKRFQEKMPFMLGEIVVVMNQWEDAHSEELKADITKAVDDYMAKHDGS